MINYPKGQKKAPQIHLQGDKKALSAARFYFKTQGMKPAFTSRRTLCDTKSNTPVSFLPALIRKNNLMHQGYFFEYNRFQLREKKHVAIF